MALASPPKYVKNNVVELVSVEWFFGTHTKVSVLKGFVE